ncbi:CRP-like cAMP-binding protein [Hypnocyclicus thermotrophus]|uniref:CRP-like cAMP-binding protein n=1 Tax=Hypnocyclicus thermotrophus TaxID=1627895 RepID=A0AA46I639_9FUSO|nr:Crp/Fnr family transcriptional regulator [Hypnocyclicus thermotrophus]TDT71774.1 CRP-like cAMP-binding protein [Hypnocyclicus thermotrophus]
MNNKLLEKYYKKYALDSFFSNNYINKAYLEFIKKNSFLILSKQQPKYFYFIVNGKFKVSTTNENGKALSVAFLEPGEVIGDVELVLNKPYIHNVEAIIDSYVIKFDIEFIKTLLKTDNVFNNKILQTLAIKLYNDTSIIYESMLYPLENRIATYLYNSLDENNEIQKLNITELSSSLGKSSRQIRRIFKKFIEENIIEKDFMYVKIIDINKLKKLVIEKL